jgi:hypothetical protein
MKFLHLPYIIDKSLVFSVLVIAMAVGWFVLFRAVESPLLTTLIPLLYIFWSTLDSFMGKVAVSLKFNYMALGFLLFAGVLMIYREFKYLWNFQIFRFFMVFAALNVIYYFFHSSDFNISTEGYAYGWKGGSQGKDAKFIIFLDSIIVFLACCVPAALFSKISSIEQFKDYFSKIGNIFLVGGVILLPVSIISRPSSPHLLLPLTFFLVLGFKFFIDKNYEKTNTYNFLFLTTIIGFLAMIALNANKTAMIAFILAFGFFVCLNVFYIKLPFKMVNIPRQKYLTPILFVVTLIIVVCVAESLGVFAKISSKINEAISSVSQDTGITSWYIRKNNWNYFLVHYFNNLDIFKLLFGYGLGASREAIFYISAMQYDYIYLVQSIHNQFMEMFYDYGLVSFLFYIPMITIFFRSLHDIMFTNINSTIKVFSAVSVSMLVFFFIYHLTDGLRVETAIVFFTYLAFCEMSIFTIKKLLSKEELSVDKNSVI